MARTSNTVLNESDKNGHLCLVPDFSRKAFSFAPLRVVLAVGCQKGLQLCEGYIPSIPTLVRAFIMNGCWTLSNALSASIEVIMWFGTSLNVGRT